jgi:phospholipase/carboxylesterase
MEISDPHRNQPVQHLGAPLKQASSAVILLHGRGGTAEDILGLATELYDERYAYLAPQAAGHSWYPYSFLAPIEQNEPWLSSALGKVKGLVQEALDAGVPKERIFVCGFSQGACLSSEFVARNPARYGGVVAFTGGLIGPPDADLRHPGRLDGMPALFSSGDPDPHVPWSRVLASAEQFTAMGADVRIARYAGRPHTVLQQEIEAARQIVLRVP